MNHDHLPGQSDPSASSANPIDAHADELSRRRVVRLGLLVGAAALIGGCASSGSASRAQQQRVPGPRYPDSSARRRSDRRLPSYERYEPLDRPAPPQLVERIIPRSSWASSSPIPTRMDPMGSRIDRITVHHDGMPPVALNTRNDVSRRLDSIRNVHQGMGWGDIGYHYVIDPEGNVWEGRPLNWQGAHVRNHNQANLGVLVLGNFEVQSPTHSQLSAVDRFVAEQMHRYRVPISRVHTHRELGPTLCPGRSLQRYMEHSRSRGGSLASANDAMLRGDLRG